MNHIFRVIFDKTRGIFVAVSELTKRHIKEKSEKQASCQLAQNSNGGGYNSPYIKRFALTPIFVATLIGIGLVVPINQAAAWNDYCIKENANKAGRTISLHVLAFIRLI